MSRCLHLLRLVMMQYELTLISSSLLPLHVRSGTVTNPPLCVALKEGNVVAVHMLIEAGADLNAPYT